MKIAIATSFDKNYMNYSMVAIKSLGENYHGNDTLDIICFVPQELHDSLKWYTKKINQTNLNIVFKTAKGFTKMLDTELTATSRYVTPNAHHRLFLGSELPEYDRIVYIDPDTLICRDIKPLLEYTSKSNFLAVVETVNMSKRSFGHHDVPYFNSGVFITSPKFWNDEQIEDKVLNWIGNNPNTQIPDQDALNAVLREYLSPLPIPFNFFEWIVNNNRLTAEEFDQPLIVHFVGEQKPWNTPRISKYSDLWRAKYSSLNAE